MAVRQFWLRLFAWLCTALAYLLLGHPMHSAEVAQPKVLEPGLKLTLFAAEPDIVTPTGAAFDHKGRLLVVESHTHHRKNTYVGPAKDRIRFLEDTNADGKADRFRTFYEGSEATMSLRKGPDKWLYVATRMKVFRIRDTDGDDKADEEQTIAYLETKGRYPHNGLAGLVFDAQGRLYFGIGENLGEPFQLIGTDGTILRGTGEGGVFRCAPDGSKLQRIATGIWNPFGMCFDAEGRLFAVDNDPDGTPPCRLLHIVPGGDYGFNFRYGRSVRHPLQAWNGELPGTLPMMAGTGEAPCAVLPVQGKLWVTSWGDQRLESYTLLPAGASWRAAMKVLVQGEHFFRPVDFAPAPDGSLYLTDWADKEYPVHGKGRVWRLSWETPPQPVAWPGLRPEERKAQELAKSLSWPALETDDPFLKQAVVQSLLASSELAKLDFSARTKPAERIALLTALRWQGYAAPGVQAPAPPLALLKQALHDADPEVRLYACRWAADLGVKELRADIEKQLQTFSPTPDLFVASLAALDVLEKGSATSFKPKEADPFLVQTLLNEKHPAGLRALALRMMPTDHKQLTAELLSGFLQSKNADLQRETVRTLALSKRAEHAVTLRAVLADRSIPNDARAEAVLGLQAGDKEQAALLKQLASDSSESVRQEATRSLQQASGSVPTEAKPGPTETAAWLKVLAGPADAQAGWRVFFSSQAKCAGCHRLAGRGAHVGPDLTDIGKRVARAKIVEAILQPSKEVGPSYVPWLLETKAGKNLQGLSLGFNEKGTHEHFVGPEGTPFALEPKEVALRSLAKTSLMPAGLEKTLSLQDFRNLLAVLGAPTSEKEASSP